MADKAIEKLKAEATEHARKGEFSLALPLFEQLMSREPFEPLWALRVGELRRRVGHAAEAAPAFRAAARLFVDRAEYIKAMAACKFVLMVDPKDRETEALLARLYEDASRQLEASQSGAAPVAPLPATPSQRVAPPPPPQAMGGRRPPPPPPQALALPHHAAPEMPPPTVPGQDPRHTRPALSAQRLKPVGARVLIPGVTPVGPVGAKAVTIPLTYGPIATRSELSERLPSFHLFQGLEPDILREVISRCDVTTHPAGTSLTQEGEVGQAMFILVDGTANVMRRGFGDALAELVSGDVFGELALVTDDPRTATVIATSDVQLLALTREAMHELVEKHPPLLLRVLSIARDRMVDALAKTSPLFAPLAQRERGRIISRFQLREIEQEGLLSVVGEPAEALHILVAGAASFEGPGGKVTLRAGDVVGEVSLLGDQPAPATIRAERRTWALALPRADFHEVVMSSPHLLSALAQRAAQAVEILSKVVVA